MKRLKHLVTSLLVFGALTGCYPRVANLAPECPDRPWCGDRKFELPPHYAPPYLNDGELVDRNHAYNLEELIDLAQRANPDTRIAWEEAKQAAFAVGLTAAIYLPQITAEVLSGYQHTPIPIPKNFAPNGPFIFDTAEVLPSLIIKWLLFDFGKREFELEAARQRSYASNVAFTAVHQKLIFEVAKAYFAFIAAKTQLDVAVEALKNTEILQDAAESKQARGLETTTDVAISRRETAKARYDLAKARADYNDDYHGLMEAMGLPPTLQIKMADSSYSVFRNDLATDIDTYICRALENRPDIIQALAKVRESEAEIGSAEAAFLPTVNFSGYAYQGIGWLGLNNGPIARVNRPGTSVFLEFKLPVYDGGTRRNSLCIARSKSAAAKENLRKTQDEAVRQVARTYDLVKSALAEYDSAQALVLASEIAHDSAIDSYVQGVGTFTNAVSTNTEKAQAESILANAYSSVLTTAAALAFSTGELTSAEALDSPCMRPFFPCATLQR